MKQIAFISGIGTDVGKTVVSAIVAQSLAANYWKPIQAGDLDNTDSIKVARLCNETVHVLPEKYRLKTPMSPHGAAEIDQVEIKSSDFEVPHFDNTLIIEGAGGMMVPLHNDGLLLIDVLAEKKWPVILVSRHYLGSINHTLLSVDALKKRNIPILGIIYVGEEHQSTEKIISSVSQIPVLGRIPMVDKVNKEFVQTEAIKMTDASIVATQLNQFYGK
ncbi:dethiobiotin synthase [Crocinitomicaceae bacterium]|jgi:dethiobiotin synthetase|nr:dethiobiotin synthase [Crocinitomicaceae bacterium]MDG1346352.1 dethiobiotin synthase [Crocinitomicaceae bacterium]